MKNLIKKFNTKRLLVITTIMSLLTTIVPAYAIGNGATMESLIGQIVIIMTSIGAGVGVILMVFGIFMLLKSFSSDDAEGKSRATQLLLVGVALITFRGLITPILQLVGIKL